MHSTNIMILVYLSSPIQLFSYNFFSRSELLEYIFSYIIDAFNRFIFNNLEIQNLQKLLSCFLSLVLTFSLKLLQPSSARPIRVSFIA